MAFNLNAFGNALGGLITGYQNAQQQAQAQALNQLRMLGLRQELQQLQQQNQAGGAAFTALQDLPSLPSVPAVPQSGSPLSGLANIAANSGMAAPQSFQPPQASGGGFSPSPSIPTPPQPQPSAPSTSYNDPTSTLFNQDTPAAQVPTIPAQSSAPDIPTSAGGGNWETQHYNFAGMRKPGVNAGPNSGGFQSFNSPEEGIAAISHQLDRYASGATTGKPLTTLNQIVSTWAPPSENDTPALIQRASAIMGVAPDQPLDLSNPQVKARLVEAMIRGEQGGRLPVSSDLIAKVVSGGGAQPGPPAAVSPSTGVPLPPQTQQAAASTAQQFPLLVGQGQGMLTIDQLAKAVAKANPGIDPQAGMLAVERLQKALAPDQQRQFQMFLTNNAHLFSDYERRQGEAFTAGQTAAARQYDAGNISNLYQAPGGDVVGINKRGQQLPTDIPPGSVPFGQANALQAPKNMQVRDKDGKILWEGLARTMGNRAGLVDAASGQPITVPAGASVREVPAGQGRQNAAMTQRLMIGANEVNKAVEALTQLPAGTTLGVFGGAQASMGEDIGENVKKILANAATPEASQVLRALSNGVSRGLAILEAGGSAQGLVGLSKQLQNDLPEANDSGMTIAAKYADVRQIVEAATEVLGTSSELNEQQKALLLNIDKSIKKSIPFTTSDVAKLVGADDETLAQFAKKAGLTKPESGSGETPTAAPTYNFDADGNPIQ